MTKKFTYSALAMAHNRIRKGKNLLLLIILLSFFEMQMTPRLEPEVEHLGLKNTHYRGDTNNFEKNKLFKNNFSVP